MNKLMLGTAQFGERYGISNNGKVLNRKIAYEILNSARDNNIDYLDTAFAYKKSQVVLETLDISNMKIVSKLSHEIFNNLSCEQIIEIIENSLINLNIDSYYGILLHTPLDLLKNNSKKIKQTLINIKNKNLAKKIGVSVYDPSELDRIFNEISIDIVQAPLSILDNRFINSGWLDKLYNLDIEFHARSIFLQGMLLFNKNNRPQKFKKYDLIWNIWDDWLESNKIDPLSGCFRYLLDNDKINKIIFGVQDSIQLQEIMKISNKPLIKFPKWPKIIDEKLLNPSHWKK
tara:strand:+ start:232 stop:1095 length:864 start_codon:yes stop_codon:yes gene_type:complete